ncbi:DUF3304 domain-containing protein [Xanthomonas maliensis]|uniref:DUF3304 domain-containing protein n=1 Tax=Xanthomonas maliensis TaxID=1321368 RepID=UPI0012640688|nr:DUF3304 domain-containing protein [Xanthomonas maliensis]KAB7769379.1 hypothetical protein CKY51_07280 [Xanthomonas maliensis]
MKPLHVVAGATIALLAGCTNGLPQARTVCVTGYNEYERQIYRFWLDSEAKSGCFGNPPGRSDGNPWGGGGKFACGCNVTPGKVVDLQWTFEQTRQEYDAGLKPEEHTIRVKIPQPESSRSRYFRVYFRKNGTTSLQWVDDMGADELAPTPDVRNPSASVQPTPNPTAQPAIMPRSGELP